MRTEHPFGLGVAWRMVGQPMGAFYPFLSGRDDFGRWPGSAGSAITEWMWCSDKQDGLNALGTPWRAAATACGNGWAWPRGPLSGLVQRVLPVGEDGPRSRCLTRPESTGSRALSRSSVLPGSGDDSSTLGRMIVPTLVPWSSQVT